MAGRVCLNCGKDISHRGTRAKTCGDTCRKALERARDAKATLEDVRNEVSDNHPSSIVRREVEREVRAIVKPVVREALTEDVMQALDRLIKLTPMAVDTLSDHMMSEDPVLAQRAATTVMRYTVGHQALVTPAETTAPQLVVQFDLPRPSSTLTDTPDTAETDADVVDETFECDVCHETHSVSQRVASSDRCIACHEARKKAVLEQYGLLNS